MNYCKSKMYLPRVKIVSAVLRNLEVFFLVVLWNITTTFQLFWNRIGDVVVTVLGSSTVNRNFDQRSGQNYRLCNWYLSLLR